MSNEELDKARAKEAWRIYDGGIYGAGYERLAAIAARLAREGWTPPEPVDPDVLAYEGWLEGPFRLLPTLKDAFLAGARMARQHRRSAQGN
jgi:hypothetical protein